MESLFSQFKFTAGGKLDSVNYTTACAAHLIKQCASSHHSGTHYRDESLNTIETPYKEKATIVIHNFCKYLDNSFSYIKWYRSTV